MSDVNPPVKIVRCPRCRKSTIYDTNNDFRPFCSMSCKNDDIIQWADQGYKIPGKPADPQDLDAAELEAARQSHRPSDSEE